MGYTDYSYRVAIKEWTIVALFCEMILAGLLAAIYYGHFTMTVHGKVIPLSDLDKASYLTEHNSFRRKPESQNMECETGWSDDLANSASAIAETCKTETPTADTLGYMIHSSNAQLTPTNVLEEVWVVYANAYDYLTNTCNLTFTTTCNHTLQFLWFEGGQIGCARSECAANTTQYLTVCAYPHRALLSMRPHTIAPPLAVCTLCSTKFPSCRDDLCCVAPTTTTTTTNTTTTTTQPTTAGPKECGCAPTSQLVDFIRLYDKKENRNIFEIDQQAVSALVAKGVSNLGSAGRVAKILNSTACPFMQPIVVMRSDRNKKNIYAIDSTAITAARYHGFVQRGTIGYAVPGKDMCQASTAIYTFRHPCLGFVQLSNVTDVKTLLADRVWRGYQWRGAEFYICVPEVKRKAKLKGAAFRDCLFQISMAFLPLLDMEKQWYLRSIRSRGHRGLVQKEVGLVDTNISLAVCHRTGASPGNNDYFDFHAQKCQEPVLLLRQAEN